jgi:hypothetical protein
MGVYISNHCSHQETLWHQASWQKFLCDYPTCRNFLLLRKETELLLGSRLLSLTSIDTTVSPARSTPRGTSLLNSPALLLWIAATSIDVRSEAPRECRHRLSSVSSDQGTIGRSSRSSHFHWYPYSRPEVLLLQSSSVLKHADVLQFFVLIRLLSN